MKRINIKQYFKKDYFENKLTRKKLLDALLFYKNNPSEFEKILIEFSNKPIKVDNQLVIKDINKPLIEIANLSKNYRINFKKYKTVLDEINLNINYNDFIALIGPNGAGKTTLIETVVGFKKQTTGTIIYNFKYKNLPTEVMGVSFQKNNFLSVLTVWDYIIFTIGMYKTKISLQELVLFINVFGLVDQIKQKVSKLSGGQQQRLNAMLALFHDPKIVFLDELSNNLDSSIKIMIINFVKKYILKNKISGIIVSHDPYEIEQLSNRIVGIKDGKIFIDINKEEAIKQYGSISKLLEKNI